MERKDFRKGYTAEGLAIVLGSILTHFHTAYSQNVGLVSLSGAKKNNVIYGMVILLLICGCIPKLGALANIIPLPVLAMIAMFGMVMAYGVSILGHIDFKNQNNLLIIAVSVGLGTGISAVPQAKALGEQFAWLTQNGIVLGAISAIILNNGLKYKQSEENVK